MTNQELKQLEDLKAMRDAYPRRHWPYYAEQIGATTLRIIHPNRHKNIWQRLFGGRNVY